MSFDANGDIHLKDEHLHQHSSDPASSFPSSSSSSTENLMSHDCEWCSTKTLVLLSVLLLVALLFRFKNPLQFYIKYVLYVTLVMVFAVLTFPFALLRPKDPQNISLVASIISVILKAWGLRIKLENSKYLQLNQPYILLVNHQSSLDFIIMMDIWPGGSCSPLAKKELMYAGPFGIVCWLLGVTYIDRLNPDRARGTIDKLAERINKENLRVWVYPEGTRNLSTELLPFKKGAFHLAVQAQIPIVCVVTSSYLNFYNKREKKWLSDGPVIVSVLPPFQTKGISLDGVGQLTKQIQEDMQKEFNRLNEQLNLDSKYHTKNILLKNGATENKKQNGDHKIAAKSE